MAEELYDLQNDPDELVNLAGDPVHSKQLRLMRGLMDAWLVDTDDQGQYPRSEGALTEVLERYPPEWLHSPELRGKSRFVPKSGQSSSAKSR
ncbi:MAG: hypothetical protein CMQ24_01785 [Gammaproteobacteria bacterium]|nr:hypothetical protein [Gammaproteobacteria bacterium]